MKSSNLAFLLMLLILPIRSSAQEENDQGEIEFAFIENANGKPGDALFLKEAKYQNTYQYEVANSIFEALVESRGDFRMQKPTFIMSKSERKVAIAKPRKGEIMLEFKAYEICTTFGKDSLNALAVLLSHELIHYYEKHSWTKYFASQNAETQTASNLKNLNERLKLETQSDYLGGFLAYSTGYQTLDIMPRLLEEVYKGYGLKDELKGYPPLSERKELATNSLKKLQSFIHVFETANYLTALEQYEQAKLYFDYILRDYQSREIYNNVGVIAAQIGMQYVSNQFLKYGLPLELDVDSRLKHGTRGNKENVTGEKVLKEALEYFEKASKLDKNYPIALLNTACVYFLLNNFDDAAYFARKALKLCNDPKWEKTKFDVFVLQGILADYQKESEKAETLFLKAVDSGSTLAKTNLSILKNEPTEAASLNISIPSIKDQIDGFSIDKSVVQLLQGELKVDELVEINTNTMCGTKRLENSTLFIHFIDEDNFTFIQMTDATSSNETNLGIKIGSSAEAILKKYLLPDRSIEISNGSFWIYFKANLIFLLDNNSTVRSWGVFRSKDENR